MTKSEMIRYLSAKDRYGTELDKCLTRYSRQNTQEVTEAELKEYIEVHCKAAKFEEKMKIKV